MTTEQDKDDAQWLEALAGRPDASGDSLSNMQAVALRRALKEQSKHMSKVIPIADDVEYQKLLFRLRREGLTGNRNSWTEVTQWGLVKGQMAARVMAAHRTLAWVIATTIVLLIALVFQSNLSQQGQNNDQMRDILRGSQGTVLIVLNPKDRAAELISGLKVIGTEPMVTQGANDSVQLRFKSSSATLEYLSTQRIEPMVTDGFVVLTLTLPVQNP
jgi:hypothetical protein